jgi:hypothetical protein
MNREAHPMDDYNPNEKLDEIRNKIEDYINDLQTIRKYSDLETRTQRPLNRTLERLQEAHMWVDHIPSILQSNEIVLGDNKNE